MELPGDSVLSSTHLQTTHAITIDAPPERVWPWLMQIGQGRAGFYADSWWWNACVDFYYRLLSHEQTGDPVRYRPPAAERIVPAWQTLAEGDTIDDGPPGTARYVAQGLDPNRVLVLFTDTHLPHLVPARLRGRVSGELSDAFVLLPLEPGRTRLVRRMRVTCRPFVFRAFALPVVLIWGEWITARKVLRGLKRRAEQASAERS